MARQRITILLVICFSLTLLGAEPPSRVVRKPVDPKLLRDLTDEEAQKKIEENYLQQRQEQIDKNIEYMNLMGTKAWTRLLSVTEAQWKIIEPKYGKVDDLYVEIRAGAHKESATGRNDRWRRSSEGYGRMRGKTRDQMPEACRVADELIDLLEDPNSTDEQIRKKIDDLQQARENARKALPKAKEELAAVLTTPRQEAVFLLMGCID